MEKLISSNDISEEMTLKLVIQPDKDCYDGIINNPAIDNNQCYQFYLKERNVTPKELISTKYTKLKSEIKPWENKLIEKEHKINHKEENYPDVLLQMNVKIINNLLDDILHSGKERSEKSKYHIGLDIPYPRENIVTREYEIELIESPTFTILHIPNSITIKGDGDYERIQKINDNYQNNRVKSHVTNDTLTQTVNSLMNREDKECQTLMPLVNEVGTQDHEFNIIDVQNEVSTIKVSNDMNTLKISEKIMNNTNNFFDNAMIIERLLSQNTLNAERLENKEILNQTESQNESFLTYCYTLSIMNNDLAIRCMHWNKTESHLLAAGYSKLIYHDYENKSTAVAVWSMKNTHTPERYYEFSESSITCLKFSVANPNCLAIGFYSGEILIIDISSRSLKIIFQKSEQLILETNGILDLFWSYSVQNQFSNTSQYECLMSCTMNGCIARYHNSHKVFEEKIILELSQNITLTQGDGHEMSKGAKRNSKVIIKATKFIELNKNTYLVSTGAGVVYICSYQNIEMKYSTKIIAHYGMIKSLEKSPYSEDIYLTTGCDCSIKIWISDIFIEPIITIYTDKQIEKAIWSRTSSTVIVSIIDNSIYIWDINLTKDTPISIHKVQYSDHTCSGIEFTSDGKHLCVSDTSGKVIVYSWSSISSTQKLQNVDNLMYCIANTLYGQTFLYRTLCKERPEYTDVFFRLNDEKQKAKFF